jgi:DNA-directed RNA polymerase subunit beta'
MHAIIAEIDRHGVVRQGHQGQARLVITEASTANAHEYLIPKGKHITVHDGEVVNKGELMDGPADPHDILRCWASRRWPAILVDEVQDVYRLQGVKINDKHIEVIVRQMLRRVASPTRATPTSSPSEQVEQIFGTENENARAARASRPEAVRRCCSASPRRRCRPSFISASSFQETTKVLTEAAIMGKKDDLRGLKENVIVGRLIPAGTGLKRSSTARCLKWSTAARARLSTSSSRRSRTSSPRWK